MDWRRRSDIAFGGDSLCDCGRREDLTTALNLPRVTIGKNIFVRFFILDFKLLTHRPYLFFDNIGKRKPRAMMRSLRRVSNSTEELRSPLSLKYRLQFFIEFPYLNGSGTWRSAYTSSFGFERNAFV